MKKVLWKEAEALCTAKLISLGYDVFIPFNGGGEIDLIAVNNSEVKRIQVKSITPRNPDYISVHLSRSSVNYKTIKYKPYTNIDWFLIYDGKNIYRIPSELVNCNINLRYSPTKNNQKLGVFMASDFII